MGLTLLLIISGAALISGIFLTAQALNASQISLANNEETATVTATTTNTDNTTTTPQTELNFTGPPLGMLMMGEFRGRGRCGFGFGRGGVEVSSDFIANVTAIAKADTDVQALLDSGYNITRVIPQIKMTVDGNGNVALKATNATLLLVNGTTGHALVTVDLQNGKVSQIVTFTRTVITKP
jgi:hypothetical protein